MTNNSPLQGIRLKNARTFNDTGSLDLAQFNFVFGKNSSGKTTLVRSPLVFRQLSQSGKSIRGDVSFSGHLVDFGSYSDFVRDGDTTREVELTYRFNVEQDLRSFGHSRKSKNVKPIDLLRQATITVLFHWNVPYKRTQYQRISLHDSEGQLFMCATRKGPDRIHFDWPTLNESRTISGTQELSLGALNRMVWLRTITNNRVEVNETHYAAIVMFQALNEALERIHHIGPLRDEPARTYQTNQLDAERDSNQGVLRMLSAHPDIVRDVGNALRQLGIAASIEVVNPAPNYAGILLKDPTSGRLNNLADVGFGVSQVLPIITLLSTVEPNSIVLIEQPELHLHPETQGALIDVMTGLAQVRNISLLIESHSENMLLRLRRRVAEGKLEAKDVHIFVTDNGKVEQAGIDSRGEVDMSAFPADFFEEDWLDSLEIAQALGKRQSV